MYVLMMVFEKMKRGWLTAARREGWLPDRQDICGSSMVQAVETALRPQGGVVDAVKIPRWRYARLLWVSEGVGVSSAMDVLNTTRGVCNLQV